MAQQRTIDRDLSRATDRDGDLVASPPDDGGHVGNFTRDAEMMEVSTPADRGLPHPQMHTDPTLTGTIDRIDPSRSVNVVTGTLFVVALVAVAIVAVLLLAGG